VEKNAPMHCKAWLAPGGWCKCARSVMLSAQALQGVGASMLMRSAFGLCQDKLGPLPSSLKLVNPIIACMMCAQALHRLPRDSRDCQTACSIYRMMVGLCHGQALREDTGADGRTEGFTEVQAGTGADQRHTDGQTGSAIDRHSDRQAGRRTDRSKAENLEWQRGGKVL